MDSFLKKYQKHPAYQHILWSIQRDWLLRFLCATALELAGAYTFHIFFSEKPLWSAAGLVIALGGMFIYFFLFRELPFHRHPIVTQLEKRRRDIVWIYTVRTQRMPFGLKLFESGLLYIKLLDGSHHCLSLPTSKLRVVSNFLHRRLPHASVGYNEEREQWYQAAPELLLQEPPNERYY